MICPHCKREIEFVVTIKRASSERKEYYRNRYLNSGKAKIRTSINQDGKCIDCGEPVDGMRWYCDGCRIIRRRETFRNSQAATKGRKAVA